MATLKKDVNSVAVAGGVSDADGVTILPFTINHTTGRVMLSSTIAAGSGITSINADTTAAQLLVTGSAGTDFTIVDNGTGTHTFNIPTASASNRGLLSTADWTTFNNKGSGTVTSVSVVSANGFAGTVATATSTPAITLTTTITGVLKGNATAISAATAGTDYTSPTGTENLTNKTLDNTNTVTLKDNKFTIQATGDVTKQIVFTLSGITTGNTRTLTVPDASGTMTLLGNASTGSGSVVLATTPTLVTPILGVATATSINKVAITAPATSATLTIADGKTVTHNATTTFAGTDGKTLTISKSLTLDGTDSTTMTFPSTSATIARTDAAQTFTGAQTFSNAVIYTNNAITASGNAATVPITAKLNTVTNNSAATLTITMTTTSATDGQMTIVRILDSSAVTQTITWVNTEDSTVTAPTTSNGSTTLFLTAGFIYNGGTSKWRCIAKA